MLNIVWAVVLGALKMTFRRGNEGCLRLVFEAHTSKAGSFKGPENGL